MHGDMRQNARQRALEQFESGKVGVLVATDVAARGLDLDDITHVINFDPPAEDKGYVHRTGRTGRAGRSGTAITLVLPEQQADASRVARRLGHIDQFEQAGMTLGASEAPVHEPPRAPLEVVAARRGGFRCGFGPAAAAAIQLNAIRSRRRSNRSVDPGEKALLSREVRLIADHKAVCRRDAESACARWQLCPTSVTIALPKTDERGPRWQSSKSCSTKRRSISTKAKRCSQRSWARTKQRRWEKIGIERASSPQLTTDSSSTPRRWVDMTLKSFLTTTSLRSRRVREMMGHQVKFFASGNEVKLKWIDKGSDVPAFVETVKDKMKASKSASAAPANGGSPDVADQIRKLAALRDEGLLTNEEYESKRAELLARI